LNSDQISTGSSGTDRLLSPFVSRRAKSRKERRSNESRRFPIRARARTHGRYNNLQPFHSRSKPFAIGASVSRFKRVRGIDKKSLVNPFSFMGRYKICHPPLPPPATRHPPPPRMRENSGDLFPGEGDEEGISLFSTAHIFFPSFFSPRPPPPSPAHVFAFARNDNINSRRR